MTIDVEERGKAVVVDQVRGPDFVVEGGWFGREAAAASAGGWNADGAMIGGEDESGGDGEVIA